MTPAPTARHQHAVVALVVRLGVYAEAHGGEVLTAPTDVFFGDRNVVEPDVLFITAEHLSRVELPFVRGAPDIVVEVSSPSTRRLELGRKRDLYEGSGVPEYWFVDLDKDGSRCIVWPKEATRRRSSSLVPSAPRLRCSPASRSLSLTSLVQIKRHNGRMPRGHLPRPRPCPRRSMCHALLAPGTRYRGARHGHRGRDSFARRAVPLPTESDLRCPRTLSQRLHILARHHWTGWPPHRDTALGLSWQDRSGRPNVSHVTSRQARMTEYLRT